MIVGDTVKRTDPDTGHVKTFKIETEEQLAYVESFRDTNFILKICNVVE